MVWRGMAWYSMDLMFYSVVLCSTSAYVTGRRATASGRGVGVDLVMAAPLQMQNPSRWCAARTTAGSYLPGARYDVGQEVSQWGTEEC